MSWAIAAPVSAQNDPYADALAAYETGRFEEALAAAEAAAQAGRPEAAKIAGVIHEKGLAGGVNDEAAVRHFMTAFEATNDADVAFQLGVMARDGRGGLPRSVTPRYLRHAADGGVAGARYELALFYLDGAAPDPARARGLMQVAAAAGDVNAQRDLGLMLLEGRGGPADWDQGASWLTRAADAGDPEAAYALGVFYSDGVLTRADDEAAAGWFQAAADAGHGRAAALLGVMALNGVGLPRSPAVAAARFEQAADAGDPLGRFYLAVALAKGDGVARDFAAAYRWVVLSEAAGTLENADENATRAQLRAALETQLGPDTAAALRSDALDAAGAPLRR